MKKIELFTTSKVQQTKLALTSLERDIDQKLAEERSKSSDSALGSTLDDPNEILSSEKVREVTEDFNAVLKGIADDFLNLEKFVNINFTGFHKILKKHDKHLPHNPCRTFYTKRLQNQSWIRGDYSHVFVMMSKMYAKLRRDKKVKVQDSAKQVCSKGEPCVNFVFLT